MYAHVNNHDNV